MEENLFLTPSQVEELTDAVQKATQRKRLILMGIPFIVSPTGNPKVLRTAVLGRDVPQSKNPKTPNWDALKKRKVA